MTHGMHMEVHIPREPDPEFASALDAALNEIESTHPGCIRRVVPPTRSPLPFLRLRDGQTVVDRAEGRLGLMEKLHEFARRLDSNSRLTGCAWPDLPHPAAHLALAEWQGGVLALGGIDAAPSATCHWGDGSAGWRTLPPLSAPVFCLGLVATGAGFLMVGGCGPERHFSTGIEALVPGLPPKQRATLADGRYGHSVVPLGDDALLLIGGHTARTRVPTRLLQPIALDGRRVPDFPSGGENRIGSAVTRIAPNRICVSGGAPESAPSRAVANIMDIDLSHGVCRSLPHLRRCRAFHAGAFDPATGWLAVAGGIAGHSPMQSIEIIDIESGQHVAEHSLVPSRIGGALRAMDAGRFALFGGLSGHQSPGMIQIIDRFGVHLTPLYLRHPRHSFASVNLPKHRVLIAGGIVFDRPSSSVEVLELESLI